MPPTNGKGQNRRQIVVEAKHTTTVAPIHLYKSVFEGAGLAT